jgi:hypothetical protein
MTKYGFIVLACWLVLVSGMSACDGDDDNGSGNPDTDADTDTDTDTDSDGDADTDDHDGELGELCRIREDCKSNYCESYWTAPPDPGATCQEGLPLGEIRITGNVRDFETEKLLLNTSIDLVGGPEMIVDPLGPPITTFKSDENGLFELEIGNEATDKAMGLGIRIAMDGYWSTATGLVETEIEAMFYPPGVRNHDIWAVSEKLADEWNEMLEKETALAFYLPLGVKGGALGKIRDADTGDPPTEPVVLRTRLPESETHSVVRYLNDAGDGFVEDKSGKSGLFVILYAALAEKFDAYRDGKKVSIHECTVGNGAGGIGATTIQVDEDEW